MKILLLFLSAQFLLISGRSFVKRQVPPIPNVANPAVASPSFTNPAASQAQNSVGDAPGAVDTSERFGLIGRLIAKHKMRQAIKHGLLPMNPGPFGNFGFMR